MSNPMGSKISVQIEMALLGKSSDVGISALGIDAQNRSSLSIPVQPRNSTIQCIFLAQFTFQMIAFPMARLPSIVDRNRFTRRTDRCQSLSTSHKPVLSALCFHGLTNCFCRNSFTLINICVAPRVSPPRVHAVQEFTSRTNQLFHHRAVMNSLSSRKQSSALESATSTLFHKKTGVGYAQNQRGLISRWEGWNRC
jgi:hypothetical protein